MVPPEELRCPIPTPTIALYASPAGLVDITILEGILMKVISEVCLRASPEEHWNSVIEQACAAVLDRAMAVQTNPIFTGLLELHRIPHDVFPGRVLVEVTGEIPFRFNPVNPNQRKPRPKK